MGDDPEVPVAVVDHLGLRDQQDCYKEIKIGKAVFKRYSQKAVTAIREALKEQSAEDIWARRRSAAAAAAP